MAAADIYLTRVANLLIFNVVRAFALDLEFYIFAKYESFVAVHLP